MVKLCNDSSTAKRKWAKKKSHQHSAISSTGKAKQYKRIGHSGGAVGYSVRPLSGGFGCLPSKNASGQYLLNDWRHIQNVFVVLFDTYSYSSGYLNIARNKDNKIVWSSSRFRFRWETLTKCELLCEFAMLNISLWTDKISS